MVVHGKPVINLTTSAALSMVLHCTSVERLLPVVPIASAWQSVLTYVAAVAT